MQLAISEGKPGFTKLLVVKELKPELLDDPEFVKMFHDEARVSARLTHPNIVQTYDVIESPKQLALVMEYVEGLSFAAVLKRVRREHFPLPLSVRILSEVLAGLHYAHELADFDGHPLNVVHRDISPHNLMIDYSGHVKLLDFGIAKARGALSQTAEGMIKGKIIYMAPECILGKAADRRADVFSVGVMLWECITGQRMGGGRPEAEVAAMRVSRAEPTAGELAPDAPPALLAVCDKALAVDPAARYQTALELRDALEPYLAEIGASGSTAELARFMVEHFAEDRERIRKVVAERAAAPPKPQEELPILVEEQSASTSLDRPAAHAQSVSTSPRADAPAPARQWLVPIGLAALIGAGAAGLYVATRTAGRAEPGSSAAQQQAPAPSAPTAAPAASIEARATPPALVSPASDPAGLSSATAGGTAEAKVNKREAAPGTPTHREKPTAATVEPAPTAAPTSAPAGTVGDPIPTARKPRTIDANDPYAK